MLESRRTLHLSLALNAVLVAGAWLAFWFLTGDGQLLCKPGVNSVGMLGTSPPQVPVPSAPDVESSARCDICASDVGQRLCAEYGWVVWRPG